MSSIFYVKGHTVFVDEEDCNWIKRVRWSLKKGRHTYYLYRTEQGKTIYLARAIMKVTETYLQVDHKNRNGLDNRKENLLITNNQGNSFNSKLYSTNKSGVTGVYKRKEKWRAAITISGQFKLLYYGYDFFEACCTRLSFDNKLRKLL